MKTFRPTRRYCFRFSLRMPLLLVAIQVLALSTFAVPAYSQEPPEPIDSEGQVTLSLARAKRGGPLAKLPSFHVIVKNDTDQAVRIPRLYFGNVKLDGQYYRFRRLPFLGDGADEIEYPPHSETIHGTVTFHNQWGNSSTEKSPVAKRTWRPIAVGPGEHILQYDLGGKKTNELRFTVEEAK